METMANSLKNSPKGQLIYKRTTDVKRLLVDVQNCTVPSLGVKKQNSPPPSSFQQEEYEEQTQSNKSFSHVLPVNEEREKNVRNKTNVKEKQSSPRTPEYLRTKLIIEEYKDICENQSKVLKKKKTSEFHRNDKYINLVVNENLENLRKKEEDSKVSQWEKLHDLFKQSDEEIFKNQKQRSEQHTHHYENIVQKLQETKRKQQEEAAQKDREQKLEQLREELQKSQLQSEVFSSMLKECQYKKHFANIDKYETAVTNLNTMANDLLTHAESSGNVTAEDFVKAANIFEELQNVNKIVKLNVETANQKGKEEEESLKAQQQVTVSPEKVTNEQVPPTEPSVKPQDSEESAKAKVLKFFSQCIDPAILKEYLRLKNKLKEVEETLEPFLKNPQLKEYVFSIRKAANTLINAISPVSGTHLKDKLTKLTMLVQGQTIEVSNKHISTKEQPEGITYAIFFIAKMIVITGLQV
ncbi:mRNA export factor GLE1-like [Octopus vulgaris]|uniref:mRNA export factor GLE1-like n=1 Tax=Octopus vulgaris TaxID=6645 RepID=A0AA36BHH8_OCTVU|nr:mRNA export factor GLE1-like [Octopus vulgaris]